MPAETHSQKDPISRDEVVALIRDQISEILEIEPDTVELTSAFVDDLGADSLALIELVEALEGELGERSVGFRIDDEDLEDLKTVADAVDYVMAKLRPASGAGGLG
ncbi:MAG: acyl carrier protein [Actinomycetota bacterium]